MKETRASQADAALWLDDPSRCVLIFDGIDDQGSRDAMFRMIEVLWEHRGPAATSFQRASRDRFVAAVMLDEWARGTLDPNALPRTIHDAWRRWVFLQRRDQWQCSAESVPNGGATNGGATQSSGATSTAEQPQGEATSSGCATYLGAPSNGSWASVAVAFTLLTLLRRGRGSVARGVKAPQ